MSNQNDMLQESGNKGFALYTAPKLRWYDLVVTQVSNRLAWRCPPSTIIDWYQQHAAVTHADVGPGTGYYLDQCGVSFQSLALLDASADALTHAAKRLARFNPISQRVNVLDAEQIAQVTLRFDSIGLNYVLHCLPGSLQERKAEVLASLGNLLNPKGVIFGATLLGDLPHNLPARALIGLYNGNGVFSNMQDTLSSLTHTLNANYSDVQIKVVGSVALFAARKS